MEEQTLKWSIFMGELHPPRGLDPLKAATHEDPA